MWSFMRIILVLMSRSDFEGCAKVSGCSEGKVLVGIAERVFFYEPFLHRDSRIRLFHALR
jgi:ribosomal protein L5